MTTAPSALRSEPVVAVPEASSLLDRYRAVRAFTEYLCEPLETEDYIVQSMEDVSPTKWHIGHTSWFFETFVLAEDDAGYRVFDPQYAFLFNSYYVAAGQRHCRPKRGLLSRPTVEEVYGYRRHVDAKMEEMIGGLEGERLRHWAPILEIGLNHEQQHQELMLTDLKHNFGINPLLPRYRDPVDDGSGASAAVPLRWVEFAEGIYPVGNEGRGFAYDNEFPRHRTFVEPFALASRLATNGDWLEFMADGGYERHELWLSAGWDWVSRQEWKAPLYWEQRDGDWHVFTLSGLKPVNRSEPVSHISYYEADAFARWSGARLPTEFEWEIAAATVPVEGNFVESALFHPTPPARDDQSGLKQMFGDVWEWTQSHYSPYPGYRPAEGALGEYNGKFMANQFVLRGGSVATSHTHIRPTYRNFFHADSSWQFTGVRLAKTLTPTHEAD